MNQLSPIDPDDPYAPKGASMQAEVYVSETGMPVDRGLAVRRAIVYTDADERIVGFSLYPLDKE